jgi:uncharacterized protein (DUF433 family)
MKSWIQTSPGICGEPCIRNTRHTVAGLVDEQAIKETAEA